jgi:hypothetical protein
MPGMRIANCSGFYGDRLSAAAEMVRGGEIDVLTGDYLAEVTMAILHRQRERRPETGYVATFLKQMEEVLGECLSRGIKVVSNAGGLNPEGLARALEALASRLGLAPKIAWIDGDEVEAPGVLLARAYLGGFGIKEALARGADVVVTGRVTDAALVVGPAAHRFEWARTDWDALAGAVVAGHVIECGAQVTGGNYPFFDAPLVNVGFPLVEMEKDGSFVVTKHPGTGGQVTLGTVTAQLLYEIHGARYANPDVVARFDTLELEEVGPDRVRVRGARGEPAPPRLKVSALRAAGYRNSVTLLVGGLEPKKKAEAVCEGLAAAMPDLELRADLIEGKDALSVLRIAARHEDAMRVGRRFSSAVVELLLATAPGVAMTAPPEDAAPCYAIVPMTAERRDERVHLGGETILVPSPETAPIVEAPPVTVPRLREEPTTRVSFGQLFGARSGDKGSDALLGVWAQDDEAYAFLDSWLGADRLRGMTGATRVERAALPNLRALVFVLRDFLEEGAAASTRLDPQAKTLAEVVRAQRIEVPVRLAR